MVSKQDNQPADVCIVGAGAAGGVLAKKLAEAGFKVVVLEAGPHWDPQNDWTSDELDMKKLGWRELRLVDGKDPLRLGHNNSGFGVGGGTCHFTGVALRFHESDFEVKTRDGVAEDWPIKYKDLEPYYHQIEQEIAVSGPRDFPWGAFRGPYPQPERNPVSANAEVFMIGCERLGIRSSVTPVAILSAPYNDRPPCTNRGFCNQGCKPNAKFSTLITYIPQAQRAGAKVLPNCMVTKVNLDNNGKVSGVTYVHDGQEYEQRTRVVILSAFVIETPRLLLNSACPQFPNGLANTSGMVGKNLMPHSSHDVYAYFDREIRLYKGTPVLASTQDFYETEPGRGFVRGYTIHAHGSRPVAFGRAIANQYLLWGKALQDLLRDYNFYARLTLVGEVLPNPNNQVALDPNLKDRHGLPVPKVTFGYGDNDLKLIAHGVEKCKEILAAAGGEPRYVVADTAHLHGTCRMGNDPKTSVVNGFCQSHDIPNLFICDASVFVTSGGANPTMTVMALAARTADYIPKAMGRREI
ncbi:MAG: GMC family oxidoreductase [Clostridia bacterium]|nr:GMC family oxidoreductase [Clostridia bacterium]